MIKLNRGRGKESKVGDRLLSSSNKQHGEQGGLWTEKYCPKKITELACHHSKVKAIMQWLQNGLDQSLSADETSLSSVGIRLIYLKTV
jgi:hypothetical protein